MTSKIALIGGLLLTSIVPAMADDGPYLFHELPPPAAWSAEDYASARPLKLPSASVGLNDLGAKTLTRPGPIRYRDAAPPVAKPGRDRYRILFDPQTRSIPVPPAKPASPKNFGTAGLLFSSSRVAPRATVVQFPFRMIGKLFFQTPEGLALCSAAIIERRLVLTAGHCVHSGLVANASGFYSDFQFVPAYRSGEAPFGVWFPESVLVSNGWVNSGGILPALDDFAIFVMLDDGGERIGDVVGRLGWQTNSLCPNHVTLLGYPGNLDFGELMHQVTTGDCVPVDNDTVIAGSDMGGGSSGGPWIQNFGVRSSGQTFGLERGLDRAVGVTSYGPSDDPDLLFQGSSILDADFLAMRDALCADSAGNC